MGAVQANRWSRALKRAWPLLAVCVAVAVIAGCGTKTVTETGANGSPTTETVQNIHFANTKFVLHMGLAFGAFHRYIYKPLKYGELRSGAPHRLATMAKAALAGAFIVHELRIARADAMSSNQLRPVVNKIDNMETRLAGLIPGLKHGSASSSAITGAANATNRVGAQSSGLGYAIHDISHSL